MNVALTLKAQGLTLISQTVRDTARGDLYSGKGTYGHAHEGLLRLVNITASRHLDCAMN